MDKSTERIKADADQHVKGLSIQHSKSHQHAGYIAGATDVYERAEPMAEVLEYIIHCPATYDKTQLLIWIDSAIAKAKQALEQWKGTGKEQFTGSTFTNPSPGITLGCISPEARDLLDTIMEQWEAHYKTVKTDTYEPTFYGFAYWLVRWSGLIQPANTNPTK